MHISLTPMRRDDRLYLTRAGDILTFNGAAFDFGPIPEGATLPQDAVNCQWLASDIWRLDGVLHLTLILPHGPLAPQATLFPVPIMLARDGPVPLPAWTELEEENANAKD
jgi:hypothetical protein